MITNIYGWPDAFPRALKEDPYDRGDSDLSVTELVKPIQFFALQRQAEGRDELHVDVADRFYALLGQALHVVLERAGGSTGLKEERLFAEVGEYTVSGQVDCYDADANVYFRAEAAEQAPLCQRCWPTMEPLDLGEWVPSTWSNGGWECNTCGAGVTGNPPQLIAQDYKLTSVNSWIWGAAAVRGEWQDQLNFLAHLLRENGYGVNRLEVVAIYRDWDPKRKLPYGAPKGATYPESEVQVIPVEMYPAELTAAVMAKRVKDRMAALELSPHELAQRYPCNAEERWNRRNAKKPPWYTRCWGGKAHGNRRRPYCPVAGICAQNRGGT